MTKCYHCKKSRFDNRKHAEKFINELDSIRNPNGLLRAYYCEYCEGYHLTKKPKEHDKKIKLKHSQEFLKYITQ